MVTENKGIKKIDTSKGIFNSILSYFKENMGILIFLISISVIMSFASPYFLTTNNLLNLLIAASSNIIIACGMTLVIILAGIDISVGSIIAFSGVITAIMIAWFHLSLFIAIIVGILSGLIIGMFNGFVISETTIPPFIVTLGTMNIARGLAYVSTNGQPVRVMSNSFNFIGSGYVFGIPMPVIYFIVLFVITLIILNRTKLGRYIYAIGGNAEAARFSGINIKRVQFFVYSFSGLMAGIAGVILASRMYSGQPTAGNGAEMDAIAAVVLGGTSFMGGQGKLGGTLIGALVMGVINNALNLLNVNSFWQYIVKGFIIIIAVYFDFIRKRKSALS